MEEWLIKFVILLSLITTSGLLIIAVIKVWEKTIDCFFVVFNLKKEFLLYIRDKYRKKVVSPGKEENFFPKE